MNKSDTDPGRTVVSLPRTARLTQIVVLGLAGAVSEPLKDININGCLAETARTW